MLERAPIFFTFSYVPKEPSPGIFSAWEHSFAHTHSPHAKGDTTTQQAWLETSESIS